MKVLYRSLLIIILFLVIGITNVYALQASFTDITVKEKSEKVIAENLEINGSEIKSKIIFKNVGEYIILELKTNINTSKYAIDSVTDNNNNDFIKTSYTYEDKNKILMKIEYNNPVSGEFNFSDLSININIKDNNGNIETLIINPNTSDNIYTNILIFIVSFVTLISLFVTKKKQLFVFALLITIIPVTVNAIDVNKSGLTFATDEVKIAYDVKFNSIDNNVTGETDVTTCFYGEECILTKNNFAKEDQKFAGWSYSENGEVKYVDEDTVKNIASGGEINLFAIWEDYGPATFDTGVVVNTKIKMLINSLKNNTALEEYDNQDLKDTYLYEMVTVVKSDTKPNTDNFINTNIVSSNDSEVPIYMWIETDSYGDYYIKWYSASNDVYFNEDSSYFFANLGLWFNISGISGVKTSNVTNMSYMLMRLDTNFDVIKNWDVSNVTNMSHMFDGVMYADFAKIANWDVSSVTDMSYMFRYAFNIDSGYPTMLKYHYNDASPISGWNVTNVTNFSHMFACDKRDLDIEGVPLSTFVFPIFLDRQLTWDNSVVSLDGYTVYSGTYSNIVYYYKSYTNNTTTNDLGKNISEVDNLLTDVDEAMDSAYSNYYLPTAVRYSVDEDIIINLTVVFRWHGGTYYLPLGSGNYEENKDTLVSAFGSNKCGMQNSQYYHNQRFYICHEFYPAIYAGDGDATGFAVTLFDEGDHITVSDYPFSMNVSYDGTFSIWRYG